MTTEITYKFRLYVAGDALNSVQARTNLSAICHQYLMDHYEIEIVDVYLEPERALEDGIFMTPTLVTLTPPTARPVVGTLSQAEPLLTALGLGDRTP